LWEIWGVEILTENWVSGKWVFRVRVFMFSWRFWDVLERFFLLFLSVSRLWAAAAT